MTTKMTKRQLIESLALTMKVSKKEATNNVNHVFAEITRTLKKGGTADISGFGKFSVKVREARTGINPLTKEKIKIKATKVPSFKASKTLKDEVK